MQSVKFILQPPMASFCPGVTKILNLTLPSELGFHEPSLFLISLLYVEPPPISRCESNGLSSFMYQTNPPGLVGYKNETPSGPALLSAAGTSVVLVLFPFVPKTFLNFNGANIIAPRATPISLRNSRREIFSATSQGLLEIRTTIISTQQVIRISLQKYSNGFSL